MRAGRTLYGASIHRPADFFAAADADGSGRLDPSELEQALLRLDVRLADSQLRQLFAAMDRDGNGWLSYFEFLAELETEADPLHSPRAAEKGRRRERYERNAAAITGLGAGAITDLAAQIIADRVTPPRRRSRADADSDPEPKQEYELSRGALVSPELELSAADGAGFMPSYAEDMLAAVHGVTGLGRPPEPTPEPTPAPTPTRVVVKKASGEQRRDVAGRSRGKRPATLTHGGERAGEEHRAQAVQEDNVKTVDLLTRRAEAPKSSTLFGVHMTIA
jgi:hypothetical protein